MNEAPIYLGALGLAVSASVPALAVARWLAGERLGWRTIGLALAVGAAVSVVVHAPPVAGFNGLVVDVVRAVGLDRLLAAVYRVGDDRLADVVGAVLTGPIVEEAAKAIGIAALLWALPATRGLSRGLIVGGMVGLGFAWLEAAGVVARDVADGRGLLLAGQLVPRFVFGGLNGHLAMSALAGAGLAMAWQRRPGPAALVPAVGGFLAGLVLHVLDNSLRVELLGAILLVLGLSFQPAVDYPVAGLWIGAALVTLVVEGPFLAGLALLVRRARREDREPAPPPPLRPPDRADGTLPR